MPPAAQRARIVLATWGSLGDLHPFLAVARGLRARGHQAVLAAPAMYRAKAEGEGLAFHPYAPDLPPFLDDPGLLRRVWDQDHGTEVVVREMILPALEQAWRDTSAAAEGADLLVSHPLTYAVPIVAEQRGIRWLSAVLAPAGLLSSYDPPYLPRAAWLYPLRRLGHWPFAAAFALARLRARRWGRPIDGLRRKLGMPAPPAPRILEFSPYGTMAWFSPLLGQPQPDWPPRTVVTGFPFYDKLDPAHGLSPELARFLDAGEPPIVFTLGSSAVMDAGGFYRESLEAALSLGRRAVLLTGPDGRNRLPADLPSSIAVAAYAPYSELFPRAAAIVHQGGIGTTAEAMRAGRPMLVVPFAHDQADNARRIARLGCGRFLERSRYRAGSAAGELAALLADPVCSVRAAEAGRTVASEDGVAAACDAVEAALS